MDPKPYVVDTSAMLAFIEDEEGGDRVERILALLRQLPAAPCPSMPAG